MILSKGTTDQKTTRVDSPFVVVLDSTKRKMGVGVGSPTFRPRHRVKDNPLGEVCRDRQRSHVIDEGGNAEVRSPVFVVGGNDWDT